MKNIVKNENKLYTLIALVIIIGSFVLLQSDTTEYSYQISILERSAIYAVVVVSMNLLTSLTGLLFLDQAGLMTIGVYVAAILTIPMGPRTSAYYVSGASPVTISIQLSIPVALLPGGLAAAAMATLIKIPVLCLKNGYLATATLGFSEIIRASITVPTFDTITNGSHGLKSIPGFPNISAVSSLAALCIALMVLPVNLPYGRVFKSTQEDRVAVQSVGINPFHYREPSFVASSFFTRVGGGMLTTFMRSIDSKAFQVTLTYGILLIVILDGTGSAIDSVAGAFLTAVGRELLCFFDDPLTVAGVSVPLFYSGFRMIIFFIPPTTVALFYSRDTMESHEFPRDGLFRPIRDIPSKSKRGRKKPFPVKKGGIH